MVMQRIFLLSTFLMIGNVNASKVACDALRHADKVSIERVLHEAGFAKQDAQALAKKLVDADRQELLLTDGGIIALSMLGMGGSVVVLFLLVCLVRTLRQKDQFDHAYDQSSSDDGESGSGGHSSEEL
ncbi:hypothetical protein K2W90_04215 [Candidatus Babeliales bacterium]|nr:hypothetical protein [Candidatus Babeliales bacterium]